MSRKSLEDNILKHFIAIDLCIEKALLMPALILIYSGLDSLASLNRPQDKENVTRSDFTRWCNNYLLPESGLKCTDIDLYAARCSILHTNTAVSDLSIKRKASELIYCIGDISERQKIYQKIIDEKYPRKTIIINIVDLEKAFKNSFFVFAEDLKSKPDKLALVYERARYYFVDSPAI
jgi:hypothetical protein